MKILINNHLVNGKKMQAKAMLLVLLLAAAGTTAQVSYVRTYDATAPQQNPATLITRGIREVKIATQYVDGLGRPVQTVIKQGSLETSTNSSADMVASVVYDPFGREATKYLPFAANNAGGNTAIANGGYKTNALVQQAAFATAQYPGETNFYSKTNFEPSPLGRVTDTYAPGSSWAGSESNPNPALRKNVQMKYYANTLVDDVKMWNITNNPVAGNFGTCQVATTNSGRYPAGQLVKTITIDEHKKQVIEFKDKEGRVILKKVQLTAADDNGSGSGYPGWLCTYYIYDDLGNLRAVLQPLGVDKLTSTGWVLTAALLDELCFRYEYDSRNRMILKKVPGAGEVNMVYDARDRLVLTQDANLKASGKWLYTQYDALNRPIATGIWATAVTAIAHRTAAAGSTAYPNLSGQTYEELSNTFYDNYNWLSNYGNPLPNTYSTAYNSYFQTASNTQWPYAQANTQSTAIKGMTTGSRVKVLGTTNTYLYTVPFYDDKGRVIQAQATNASGGIDITTTQYTWAGQPLFVVQKHQKEGTNPQEHIVINKMEYDDMGRLLTIKKSITSTVNGETVSKPGKTIVQNEYDKLGQLKKKSIGDGTLETLNYEYNIRGWILGANRDYVKDVNTTNYFGFELAYDKTGNIIPGQSYAAPQYNGNITGTTWKAAGDGEKRKYDFSYDAANRLTGADFNQLTGTAFNKTAGMDYSVSNLNFDANGNILTMWQKGWKINGSPTGQTGSNFIDRLSYTYQTPNGIGGTGYSNKLQRVVDESNDNASKLGDFKYDANTKTNTDYTYDANGNMVVDNNKKINGIAYNYLNLPQNIDVTSKGSIEYVYDAAGNKLKKIVHETGKPDKTTEYIAGFVYEDDQLQFTGHEEGRIRFAKQYYLNGDSAYTWQYDYFLKDHLGNIRTVLTEQTDTAKYMATFEIAERPKETALFSNITETAFLISNVNQGGLGSQCLGCIVPAEGTGYPADGTTIPNNYVSRLNGEGKRIGAAITLKVMAGDKIDLATKVWYPQSGYGDNWDPGDPEDVLTSLITTLSGGAAGLSGNKATSEQLAGGNSPLPGGIQDFLNSHTENPEDASRPRAYLNWMLLDEQFNYVPAGSGFIKVPGFDDDIQTLAQQNIPVAKSGYLFVYLSNETRKRDVFFDNLVVQHYSGPLSEENQYYPFGLVISGISSKAAGKTENKRKWNAGSELSTDFDINLYETRFRSLDPQIGRFWQIDPKPSEFESLYSAMGNNPILRNDPLGDTAQLTGKYVDKLLELINQSLGGFYTASVDKKGILSLAATDKKGDQGQAKGFYEVLSGVVGDKRGVVSIGTVSGSKKVDVDSWVQQKIDVKDAKKFGNGKYRSIASVIAHAFAEQQSFQLDNKGDRDRSVGAYYRDHEKGILAEQKVTGYKPTTEFGEFRNNIFGNTKGTMIQAFAKPTGTFDERGQPVYNFTFSSMTFKNGNLVSYIEDVNRPEY
jgi:RHS repeat-associated protein